MGHGSHHKKSSVPRRAARIALILGILAFVGATLHFIFTAYESSECYTSSTDPETGQPQRQKPVDSGECRMIISETESHQRVDATIALVAIVFVVGGAVRLSNANRRTRRLMLIAEVAVVVIGVIYTILLASILR
jgi:hypothetical protein